MQLYAGQPQGIEAAPAARVGDGGVGRRIADWWALPLVVVGLLTVVGVAFRLVVAHQSLFADEASTYWIVTKHGFADVISSVHGDAEITPPSYFMLAWLTTQIGHAPELVRAPSLVAGAVSIPVIYVLGLRTVGRPAALLASALTALSPFMIYYSSEARGYAVMMVLVMGSTLAMLLAVDRGGGLWWVVYAACSCAAVYTHYTSVFALGAQLLWLLWAHPEVRRPAILANLGALAAFLPWSTGVINDFNSPTTKILSALSPFDASHVRLSLEHWGIGAPTVGQLSELPGKPALVMLALALIAAVAGLALRILRGRPRASLARLDRRLVLVIALLLSVPIGEAIVSAVTSTRLFNARDLAASWPAFALCLAALLVAAGPRLRMATAALAIAAFAIGATTLVKDRYHRPNYQAAADFIDRHATSDEVVLDETKPFSAGPLSPLDIALHRPHRVLHGGTISTVVAAANGGRIFVAGSTFFPVDARMAATMEHAAHVRSTINPFPTRYRLAAYRVYPGIVGAVISVYADPNSQQG